MDGFIVCAHYTISNIPIVYECVQTEIKKKKKERTPSRLYYFKIVLFFDFN